MRVRHDLTMPSPDVTRVKIGSEPSESRAGGRTTKAGFTIAARLRERIVRGELSPGEALPVESLLIEQLGASKSVIREGLRILEMEGLVTVRRGLGGGSRVTHPSIVTVSQAVGVHLQLQEVSILDVWAAHTDLASVAIARLADSYAPGAIASVELAIDSLEEKVGARSDYSIAVTRVVEELVRQAGNATQHLLISALSEVIASELASADAEVGYARTDVQREIVATLRSVLTHIAAGRSEMAQRTYREQAAAMAAGLELILPGATVVDVFPWRMPISE
jgi:GntR family transcriptional regulator, transcriptional repressor for pyruvate dehydrogenase complex